MPHFFLTSLDATSCTCSKMSEEITGGGFVVTWRGGRAHLLNDALRNEILHTIFCFARGAPVTVHLALTETIEEFGDDAVLTPFVRGENRYLSILERHFTLIFNLRDVHNAIIMSIMSRGYILRLP